MKKVMLVMLVAVLLISFGGCDWQKVPHLDEVIPEKGYYDYNDYVEINFKIINGGKTTFSPEIEVTVNETCYYDTSSNNLASIAPGGQRYDKISIQSKNNRDCKDSEQTFIIILKDKSGSISLDDDEVKINVRE